MINIAMRSQGAIDNSSLSSINTVTNDVVQAQTINTLNTRKTRCTGQSSTYAAATSHSQLGPGSAQPQSVPAGSQYGQNSVHSQTAPSSAQNSRHPAQSQSAPAGSQHGSLSAPPQSGSLPVRRPIPALQHKVQKGQKISLEDNLPLRTIKACLGWNTTNTQCDVDVSAFLLASNGKVPGDAWFIFYGQTESPDRSTTFFPENHLTNSAERESITIHLDKLNANVKKIVFVLTIHEAIEKKLHFGMIQDAYIRILNADTKKELVSFQMADYYSNVISMMIGEVYQHNGTWKFNAVGNGVAKDLSGLCEMYGVQVSD